MRVSNLLNSAIVFAAKTDVRYYLNGINIYFKGDRIRAVGSSDGHTAQILSVAVDESKNISSYENLIVSTEDAKRISAIYSTSQVEDVSVEEIKKHVESIEGNYPDLTRLLRGDDAKTGDLEIGIDYSYLAKISASMSKLTKGSGLKNKHAKFKFIDAASCIRVDVNAINAHALILIMPCRL